MVLCRKSCKFFKNLKSSMGKMYGRRAMGD
ncbi:MAG: hypothetical protein ACI90V_008441 [Bacillariaceae sp.]